MFIALYYIFKLLNCYHILCSKPISVIHAYLSPKKNSLKQSITLIVQISIYVCDREKKTGIRIVQAKIEVSIMCSLKHPVKRYTYHYNIVVKTYMARDYFYGAQGEETLPSPRRSCCAPGVFTDILQFTGSPISVYMSL